MFATISSRLGIAIRLLRFLPVMAFLSVMIVVSVALFAPGARTAPGSADASGGQPENAAVLHLRAMRSGAGAGESLEAWLDLATNEGKIVETGPDGAVRRVTAVSNGVHTLYLADRGHAVIRRGFGPASPHAGRIRDELFGARRAAEQGNARVVGAGRVGDRVTDRIQVAAEGSTRTIDIDRETGLVLREEMSTPGGRLEVRETAYPLREHVSRASLPAGAFEVVLPADIGREEYTESDPGDAPAGSAEVPYAVYGASAGLGAPTHAFRRFSTTRIAHGPPPSDAYYLMYHSADGQVWVRSSSPDPATRQAPRGGKPEPARHEESLEVANAAWSVQVTSPTLFQASANLGDAYVTVGAPNRAAFERVAASLRRLNR